MGVASASEDVNVVDELATSDVAEVPIEESSVDEIVEETYADNVLDEDEYQEPEHDPVEFKVAIKGTVDLNNEDDFVFNYTVPKEAFGNLHVYAGEYSELVYYTSLSYYSSGTIVQVSADDLQMGNIETVFINVVYEPFGGNPLTLASGTVKTIKSNVEYIKVNSSVDFSIEDNSFIEVSDYGHYLDGNVSVYVDDDLKLTRNISAGQEEGYVYFTVNDLNLYNNISIGNHSVCVVYLKNNGKKHSLNRTVNFYIGPHFRSYYKISVGENETFIVNYIKDFNGTATLYKGVNQNEESNWKKGEEVGSSNFTDGVATIPFGNLTKGGHVFILTISNSEEEHQIQVDVVENTPGITACLESQVIVGNNVVVNFTGPVSENQVRFYVDDKEYKSVLLATGVLNETISGLVVGTHKIRVLFEDGEKFYSNTFHVIVKDKPIPPWNNTFTDLTNDISASGDVFEIEKNYKFNNKTDDGRPIRIVKDNFVINGNGHTIDGNGQASMFSITGKNVTINNLKFVNGYSVGFGGAIITGIGPLTLNNVTFINNTADESGGAMAIVENCTVNLFNCNFIDCYSYHGSALYLEIATVNIEYSNFTSKYFSHWGSIFTNQMDNELFIDNCIFSNIYSTYTPAVFAQDSYVIINNTEFNNLKADESAGAVAIRTPKLAIIENCLFVNTTSTKNAGALFIDIKGEADEPITEPIPVTVRNSTFNNISSGFGGAFVQLTGNLTLEDSSFTKCCAAYAGGAAYLSDVVAEITNCKFNSNKVVPQPNYQTSGGALYFDYGILNIADSEFNNNNASMASGILIYDSEYHLDNITFNNNNNPVYTYFDDIKSTIGQVYGDKISKEDLNNTYYISAIIGEGMKLNLTTNNIDLTILPTRFDLREIGWLTPIRDQGNMGSCWAFGGVAALESALLKNTGISYDISENNMQDSMLIFSRYGSDEFESANEMIAAGYLLSWLGAFPQGYDVYDELGKLSPVIHTNQTIHVQDFVLIDDRNISIPGDPALKKAILKYGALAVLFDGFQDAEGYNITSGAFYHLTGNPNHSVALVGWDDNYPKENFATLPEDDGAWIIKNSWGTQCGDEGYMYISYYDGTLAPDGRLTSQPVAYVFENTLPYNKNYQYDFTGINFFVYNDENTELYGTPVTNVNNYVSAEDDLIAAVGTYFNQSGMDYTVTIAVNGAVVYTQSGVSPYRGYHTIKLDKYIPIKKGDKFSIYVTSMALGVSYPERVHYEAGVSLTNVDDGSWKDSYQTYGFVACIKAYTLKDDTTIVGNKNIAVDYDGGKYFSVKVTTADGHVVAGASVNFNIKGQPTTVRTDDNGIAKIMITQLPGTYYMTTTYNGKTYKNSVIVKHVLKASKVTVKKTAKKFTLKAALKINGKLVKGKIIAFKFMGKTYKVKTNAKGIAQKTFNKNVINKLRKGKTYVVKVTYLKDTIKTTLKVR